MSEISTIGLDLAKNVFQIHAIDALGGVVLQRQLRRGAVEKFFAQLPPCMVGIEACGSAHHWARVIGRYGHEVRLMPPAYVKPYVKRNKNDGRDAEAICEAVRRPTMRFVPVKSVEQQATMAVHSTRSLLVRQRTMVANSLECHDGGTWQLEALSNICPACFDISPGEDKAIAISIDGNQQLVRFKDKSSYEYEQLPPKLFVDYGRCNFGLAGSVSAARWASCGNKFKATSG